MAIHKATNSSLKDLALTVFCLCNMIGDLLTKMITPMCNLQVMTFLVSRETHKLTLNVGVSLQRAKCHDER